MLKSYRRRWLTPQRAAGVAIGAAGVSNAVTNLWLPPGLYVPWNLWLARTLVALARSAGVKEVELGLDRRQLAHSARVGAGGATLVAAGYAIAVLTRIEPDLFRDERVSALPAPTALWHLLVRIPLGTALAEELTFRGVLPALLASRRRAWLPGVASSVLFGLWHVLPSRELASANTGFRRMAGDGAAAPATLAFLISTLAGGVFYALRRRSGHVAAPVLVHLAANSLGFLVARLNRGDE